MEKKEDSTFKPYITEDKEAPELNMVSIILGSLLAIVFGGANAYLGLRVGLTVSASIPAAVVSMGIMRKILKRNSILENNMVQTIGSAGESLAAGAIFTLPALFMWANEGIGKIPSLWEIGLIALSGGALGVLLMIPLRNALIVKEHGLLTYPEGQACAEVLMAGEEGGRKSVVVFAGLGIAAIYKFLSEGLKLFPSEVDYKMKSYKGAGFGIDVLPALAGVGYICGPRVSSYIFSGGILAWLVIMPLIVLFGSDKMIYPAQTTISELWESKGTWGLWSSYIRYIGAGAVAAGGIISLTRTIPLIMRTFKDAIGGYGKTKESSRRTEQNLPMNVVALGAIAIAIFIWLIPTIPVNLFGAIIIILFGFFFATVSSRMVGLIGSSNNPVSGMAIATLLISTMLLKFIGNTGTGGMVASIAIGSVICIIAALAGDTSQDLKTGFLLGATPKKQQIGELVGCLVSSIAIGGILYLLNLAWGYGSLELPAPQATLMKLVVEGVMEGNLPWSLVYIGVFIAVFIEILGIPVLPFAIGLYLPLHLSTPIMAGGLIRVYMEKRKCHLEDEKEERIRNGILYTSGLIAGEGMMGILLALFAIISHKGETLLNRIDLSEKIQFGNIGALIIFFILLLSIIFFSAQKQKS